MHSSRYAPRDLRGELRVWVDRSVIRAMKIRALKENCTLSTMIERVLTQSLTTGENHHARSE